MPATGPEPLTRQTKEGRVIAWGTPLYRLQPENQNEQNTALVGDVLDVCQQVVGEEAAARLTGACKGKTKGENVIVAPEDIAIITNKLLAA